MDQRRICMQTASCHTNDAVLDIKTQDKQNATSLSTGGLIPYSMLTNHFTTTAASVKQKTHLANNMHLHSYVPPMGNCGVRHCCCRRKQSTPLPQGAPHTATSPVHACAAASSLRPCQRCCLRCHKMPRQSHQPPSTHHSALCCRHDGAAAAARSPGVLLLPPHLLLLLLHGPVAQHAHAHVHDLALTKPQSPLAAALQGAALLLAQVLYMLQHVLQGCLLHALPPLYLSPQLA